MAKNRSRQAYGAPAEEKEVVVTVDKRILAALGLVVVLLLAIGLGVFAGRRGGSPETAAAPQQAAAPPVNQQVAVQQAAEQGLQQDLQDAVEAAKRSGIDESMIIDPGSVSIPQSQPMADNVAEQSGDSVEGVLDEWAAEDPDSAVDLGQIDPQTRANVEEWTHAELATLNDVNVTAMEFKPFRAEDFADGGMSGGARLAISDLNNMFTYDFGRVPIDEVATHDFVIQNVGDEDLRISRIYSGCGCTAPRIGDVAIDGAGFLPEPYVLAPGEEVDFTVEFDPRLAKETKAQAKWIQIFSNDDTKEMFDETDPLSHETRFRIVVQPEYSFDSAPAESPSEADEAESGETETGDEGAEG